ncbi:MAG: hypothetical protein KAX49_07900 [Halanaerobiales bacterium]|nr:hypothetical protein [Halanaerobiales bacterium]
MSVVLFFSYPLFGHVNYGLKLAKKLTEEGEDVIYFSGKKYKNFIEDKGVSFLSYNDQIEEQFGQKPKPGKVNYLEELWMLGDHILGITDNLLQNDLDKLAALKPDYIIYDALAIWGMKIARELNIPVIASVTSYTYNDEMIKVDPEMFIRCILRMEDDILFTKSSNLEKILNKFTDRLQKKYPNVRDFSITANYYGHEELNLLYTSRDFQCHQELLDQETYVFTGPLIDEYDLMHDVDSYICPGKKLIYVAMGTVHNNINLYKQCIEAVQTLDAQIIISVGEGIDIKEFGNLPETIIIANNVPQIKLLDNVDLFISHGGANSAREAMCFGVPMLVIPQAGDHYLVAEDVERLGVGIYLRDQEISVSAISSACLEILENSVYYDRCQKIADSMKKLGGLNRAVSAITNFKKQKGIG